MPRRLSLRTIMLGLIALATLGLTLPGLGWLMHNRIEQEREDLLMQARRLTAGAAPLLVNALVVGDFATAEQTLAQLNRDHFFARLSLIEPEGAGEMIGTPRLAARHDGAPAWFGALLGATAVSVRVPIESGSQRYAVLLAEPDLAGARTALWAESRYLLVGALGLNVLLALIIGAILTRGFRPIRHLGEVAERLGKGDFAVRMEENNLPEVCPTVHAFNSMAGNIEKLLAEVRSQAAANRKLAAIVAQTDEAILTLDHRRFITSWNRGAERLLGFGAYEMLERPVSDLILSVALEPEREVDEMLATRPPAHWETRLRRKSGGDALVAVSASPLMDEDLSFAGTILVARDISRIKAAEIALMHAKEAAETANRMKSEFLANMSHEIRTPMNGIIGMTDLALGTELDAEQQEYLGLVKSSANALLTVINDILDFSKIEAGRLDMETLPFNLRAVIGDTVKSQAIRLQDRPVELLYHVADDIPDILLGDPGRLRQVLLNLLGNAIKFTEAGEIAVQVERQGGDADQVTLHLSLRDTGIGIPAHKLAHIFDAFTQADSSITRRYGGTGLGLTITRRLVEMMGGGIWAESEEGRGSVFHFTAAFGVGEDQPDAQPIHLAGLRVLVVDDNATNRRILCDTLENAGVQVESANGGGPGLRALALANVRGQPFDALLLDVQMPGMDGFAVADQIHLDPAYRELRVVMLSSVGLRGDATYCRELGLAAYLTKPISPSEVLDAIRMVMGQTPHEARVVTRHSLHEQPETAAPPTLPAGPLDILLVEDNAINQKLAATLLQREGHRVALAEHGQEALERMQQNAFDLILMDMQMPVMDGLECTRRIRALEKERGGGRPVRIVAMTANAFPEDRDRCLQAGMDDYLSKPLRVDQLKRALAG
ncbi:MAG: response regulator [Betaproteobacteria bacterium]|nr:response regulator [Betaproteobacteria bacterium]